RPFGVIVPLRRWCGVRAALPRGSSFGLLSVRTTFCSNVDGWPYGGIGTPGARLQGPFVSGSGGGRGRGVVPAGGTRAGTSDAPTKQSAAIKQAIGGDRVQRRRRASILATLAHAHDFLSLSGWSASFAPIYSDTLMADPDLTSVQNRSQSGP